MEQRELEAIWTMVLHRLEVSRRQGSYCILTAQEARVMIDGIESFENELVELRQDQGPLLPLTVRTQDDAPVITS